MQGDPGEKSVTSRIGRWPKVQALVDLSRSTVDRLERKRDFPQRVQLGPNSVGWYLDEVEAWCAARPSALLGLPRLNAREAPSYMNKEAVCDTSNKSQWVTENPWRRGKRK